jgi:hypothetical protein
MAGQKPAIGTDRTVGLEDLDDDHATTAARARCWQGKRLIRLGGSVHLGLDEAGRHGEQLAGARKVGHAVAAGEQPIMADAVKAVGSTCIRKRLMNSCAASVMIL